ncbi:hypothetical protein BDN71DRAFT_1440251 [Pleurotus eryngii]|uniref:HECT-like ubiquitin-conjugating enzyme-binding-domain-containing protein n=1 Tax=Pleurotus eryngii TaxID=5323 RepID=A0A9P6A6D7_PLEER|nr:hypothetical protein BDN71DRAFT_1440251 [Pleurotus eryngii]
MATLAKSKLRSEVAGDSTQPRLDINIPAPFPVELHQHLTREAEQINPRELPSVKSAGADLGTRPAKVSEVRLVDVGEGSSSTVSRSGVQQELMPSIGYVQRSCITTLNDLLSESMRWSPILPDRRHSMPSTPQSPVDSEPSATAALHTLVSNLRNCNDDMIEVHNQEEDLINELRARVEILAPNLPPADAQLAQSLVSLLSNFQRLSRMQAGGHTIRPSSIVMLHPSTSNPFDALRRQLSDFQVERLSSSHDDMWAPRSGISPVTTVESSLLWTRIDEELECILAMCKERTDTGDLHLPPRYSYAEDEHDRPPDYDHEASVDDYKTRHSPEMSTSGVHDKSKLLDEKMRLDLEAVTMAIDRLYVVAPQLHNQRVELKSSKVKQLELAKQAGVRNSSSDQLASAPSLSRIARGKQKADTTRQVKDLENMLDLLGKASSRTMRDQSFVLSRGSASPMEKAKQRDTAKREAFVEHLAQHSDAGRLHTQDAELHDHPRLKDPNALLSLPEFIRESIPETSLSRDEDMDALLSLPEFVKELPPPRVLMKSSQSSPPAPPPPLRKKRHRVRSLSAPSISWLKSSKEMKSSKSMNPVTESPTRNLEVNYVAENHESLHHILVFLMVSGAVPGVDLEAEVLPSFSESPSSSNSDVETNQGDRLIIKSGVHVSLPVSLPGRTTPGKKEIKVQGEHYEIKLSTTSPNTSPQDAPPLLDATELNSALPTSFICSSCSLPIVQATSSSHSSSSPTLLSYRDLPSEHWQELVDAWMCHADQKLTEQVSRHAKAEKGGFWPRPGQALVGGSYILFREDTIVTGNVHPPQEMTVDDDEWRVVRCLCGAVVGRSQVLRQQDDTSSGRPHASVYRLLKYAIRPVSQTAEPLRIPLSAFIVEDMNEFVQAHATYRFIILDEEEEKPRMLIWLFKPNLRLAYKTSRSYAIPQSSSIRAAKVLYKTIGPSESSADLKFIVNKYPGFPQAEYLYYPINICRRLASLLVESNRSYPESMRTMTGLDVGWLRKV